VLAPRQPCWPRRLHWLTLGLPGRRGLMPLASSWLSALAWQLAPSMRRPAPAFTLVQAADRRMAEEAELAARLAHEARQEFEREEAARKEAKEALKAFLLKWAGARRRQGPLFLYIRSILACLLPIRNCSWVAGGRLHTSGPRCCVNRLGGDRRLALTAVAPMRLLVPARYPCLPLTAVNHASCAFIVQPIQQ
jgi:hypothetical protein